MTGYRPSPGPPCSQPMVLLACKCNVIAWPVFAYGGSRPEVFCELHGFSQIRKKTDPSHLCKALGIKVKRMTEAPPF